MNYFKSPTITTPLVLAAIALLAVAALHWLVCYFCDSRDNRRKVAIDRSTIATHASEHLIDTIESYVRELLGTAFPYNKSPCTKLLRCLKSNRYYQLISGIRPSAKQSRLGCGVQLHVSLLVMFALVAAMFIVRVSFMKSVLLYY